FREGVIAGGNLFGTSKDENRASLEYADGAYLVFIAPVVTEPLNSSVWEVELEEAGAVAPAEKIGSVKLVFSKESLKSIQNDILQGNFGVSFIVALLLLGMVIFMTRKMTIPLKDLSAVMLRAQQGEINLRAS